MTKKLDEPLARLQYARNQKTGEWEPAQNIIPILGLIEVFKNQLIALTAVVLSPIYRIEDSGYFGLWYKTTSIAGAPDTTIEFLMSYDTNPDNFIEPEGASNIETNLITETAHVRSFAPSPMKYLRFKITGNAGNQADTLLTMYLFAQ